jgi:hypothetical protein
MANHSYKLDPTSVSLRMANVSSSRAICSDPLTPSLSRSINLLHRQLMYSPPPELAPAFLPEATTYSLR